MFITKFLDVGFIDNINTSGRFIKIVNSESVLRLRATYQGKPVLDTEARAGFDVQTGEPFDLIELTSNTKQKLEIWVSNHKLSYDAISLKPSKANSFLVDYYGGRQLIAPADAAQSRLKVSPSFDCVYGGSEVDFDNGFELKAGDIYTHDSAAPFYINSRIDPEYLLVSSQSQLEIKDNNGAKAQLSRAFKVGDYVHYNLLMYNGGGSLNLNTLDTVSNLESFTFAVGVNGGLVKVIADNGKGFYLAQCHDNGQEITRTLYNLNNQFVGYALRGAIAVNGVLFVQGTSDSESFLIHKIVDGQAVAVDTAGLVVGSFANLVYYSDDARLFFITSGSNKNEKLTVVNDAFAVVANGVSVKSRLGEFSVVETEKYITFPNSSTVHVYNKLTNDFLKLPVSFYAAYAKDNQLIGVDSDGVHETRDFVSYENAYPFASNPFSNSKTFGFFHGESFCFFAVAGNDLGLVRVPTAIDPIPKGKIKVLRESF